MLTPLQVGQFRAMGFLNIEGCLSPAEVGCFAAAYDRLLAAADQYDYFEENLGLPSRGTLHHGTAESDDGFASFIEHDNIVAAQRDIFGSPCLFQGGSVWLNMSDTPWHSDVLGDPERDPDFFQIKVAIYLDELDADSGSLNVIPGSHFPAFGQALLDECGYKEGGARPRLQLESPPGAVSVASRRLLPGVPASLGTSPDLGPGGGSPEGPSCPPKPSAFRLPSSARLHTVMI